jgi:hypothetical protein
MRTIHTVACPRRKKQRAEGVRTRGRPRLGPRPFVPTRRRRAGLLLVSGGGGPVGMGVECGPPTLWIDPASPPGGGPGRLTLTSGPSASWIDGYAAGTNYTSRADDSFTWTGGTLG